MAQPRPLELKTFIMTTFQEENKSIKLRVITVSKHVISEPLLYYYIYIATLNVFWILFICI